MKIILAAILGLFLSGLWQPQTNERGWRGIVPLQSTRAEVERLLGPGTGPYKSSYYLDEFNAFFTYSSGDCENGGSGDWNIPPDTVINITINLKDHPKLSDHKFDESRFEKRQEFDDDFTYINQADGLSFNVSMGRVQSFHYSPRLADEALRCPGYDGISYSSSLPKEQRPRLREMLSRFVEYSRTAQFEKQYELYLPDFAAKRFSVKDKHEYAGLTRSHGDRETYIDFQLLSVGSNEDKDYGKIYEVFGLAKTLQGGKAVESYQSTQVILKDGEWYFVSFFRLLPQ